MVNNSELLSPPEQEIPFVPKEKMSRRDFLKLLGAIILSRLAGRLGLDPEVQAGVKAALSRPELPGDGEKHEASESVLLETYKKHFQNKQHLLPEKVWVRAEETTQTQVLRGTGTHLAILAQNCYAAERKDGGNL
jgi:hypothetical protein